MSDVRYTAITLEEEGQRLDNYLIRILKGVPRSYIYRIIRAGEVRINKKRAKPSTRLVSSDTIRIPPVRMAKNKAIQLTESFEKRLKNCIVFEDNAIMVVNKPIGVAAHGGSGLSLGIIEALRKIRSDLPYLELVHRLDKDTSGCLLFAKKRSALRAIGTLFAEGAVHKTYWALQAGPWSGTHRQIVEAPLLKNTVQSGERMVVVSQTGKPSLTKFRLLKNYQSACWVEATPETGRTHQIRVHSACLSRPIIGDEKYGSADLLWPAGLKKRLYLHARALDFHWNGAHHHYEADLDAYFEEALQLL